MDNAKKGLLNGTFVYFIGNATVSIIQLFMLRFITGNINPDGVGYYNTIVSVDNLITPVLTLQISDAVFRYVIKGDLNERKKTVTNGTIIVLLGIIVTVIGVFGVNYVVRDIPHCLLVILYIISTNVFALYQKLARAVGANICYIKTNLLKAVLYLLLQVVCIFFLHMKEESLFIALIIATAVCLIYLELKIKAREFVSLKFFDKTHLKTMLNYSVPLIPNTMLWWLSSSVNALLIVAILGTDHNGIYTVAGKFSAVIAMVASVFNLAWQESAIKEYDTEGGKKFFREVYIMFYRMICSGIMVCIPLMYILLPFLIDSSYYEAIKYAPVLVIGAGFSAAYGFFGEMYSATGKTKGIAITTFFGVITNLTIVLLFIGRIGLWAPSIAVLFSGCIIMILRYRKFKTDMCLSITKDLLCLIILILLLLVFYYLKLTLMNYICLVICLCLAVWINRGLLSDMKTLILSRLRIKK